MLFQSPAFEDVIGGTVYEGSESLKFLKNLRIILGSRFLKTWNFNLNFNHKKNKV